VNFGDLGSIGSFFFFETVSVSLSQIKEGDLGGVKALREADGLSVVSEIFPTTTFKGFKSQG